MTTAIHQRAPKRVTETLRASVIAMRGCEDKLHVAIADLLRRTAAPGVVWWHTPNGGRRSKREAARFRSMGVLAGVSDFAISLPNGRFGFIEVKSPRGQLSAEQHEFLAAMKANGHFTEVIRSVDGALGVLKAWGAIRGARVAA
jgi:hypothetical protein